MDHSEAYDIYSELNNIRALLEGREHLTKREQFAMAAMGGIIASERTQETTIPANLMARDAVFAADALIAELDKTRTHDFTSPVAVFESVYPNNVEACHRDECFYDEIGAMVFAASEAVDWERVLCEKLDPSKRYQMHITFVEIDE